MNLINFRLSGFNVTIIAEMISMWYLVNTKGVMRDRLNLLRELELGAKRALGNIGANNVHAQL